MALFRALSTTKGRRGGYDKLLDEANNDPNEANNQSENHQQNNAMLKRAISVPARVLFGSSNRKMSKFVHSETNSPALFEYSKSTNDQQHQGKQEKKKGGKVHPVFGLFDGRSWRKKKLTANPDFSRYIEYLKEGGVWNKDTDSPAIHFK